MNAWAVVGLVLLGLLGLLGLVLATWLRLDARVDAGMGRVRLRWTAMSVSVDAYAQEFEVRLGWWRIVRRPLRASRGPSDAEERPERQAKRRLGWSGIGEAWSFYRRQAGFVVRRIRLDRFDASLRIATPDPAVTGILYGAAVMAAQPIAARWPNAALTLEPDFVGTFPGGSLVVALRVRIATLAWAGWRIARFERSRAARSRAHAAGKGRDHDGSP